MLKKWPLLLLDIQWHTITIRAPVGANKLSVNSFTSVLNGCFQMLNCILGMVEKTQRAIRILQQRQQTSSSTNNRTTEEVVADLQVIRMKMVMEFYVHFLDDWFDQKLPRHELTLQSLR